MVIKAFPPVTDADEHGLLAVGGDLDVESLLLAYKSGIFPWPCDEKTLLWFAPPQRAVVFLNELRVPHSLKKSAKRLDLEFAIDRDFAGVMAACSEVINRGQQQSTWITSAMRRAYLKLHQAGFAHSFEGYHKDQLVGGFYGVSIGTMFAGESMFYRLSNASKLIFWKALSLLNQRGVKWFDCQMMTPLSQAFGAKLIPRSNFMELLQVALQEELSSPLRTGQLS